MSKKQLNSEIILNELKQGSVFFEKREVPDQDERTAGSQLPHGGDGIVRPDEPEGAAGTERPVRVIQKKREIRRHSFEIYRDQVPKLKQLKTAYMLQGAEKSMSAMVREAIDGYLDQSNTRTDRTRRSPRRDPTDRTEKQTV